MSDRDCEKCKHHTEKGCDSWDCEFERRLTQKEAMQILKDNLIMFPDSNSERKKNEAIRIAINDIESMDLLSKVAFKMSDEVEE